MAENSARSIVESFYKAYAAGDIDRCAALIHDEIDWIIYGPVQVFPFAGPRRGKQAALETIAAIGKEFALERYVPDALIVEGDRAAIFSNAAFRQRSTGRTISVRLADFLHLRDGKIVELRELFDTFDAVEQALGRWIEV